MRMPGLMRQGESCDAITAQAVRAVASERRHPRLMGAPSGVYLRLKFMRRLSGLSAHLAFSQARLPLLSSSLTWG